MRRFSARIRLGQGARTSTIKAVQSSLSLQQTHRCFHRSSREYRNEHPWGLARTGGAAANHSGDIFVAFSTTHAGAAKPQERIANITMLSNDRLNSIFAATMLATAEAIINALVAAETMIGRDDHKVHAIPHDRIQEVMKKYRRLVQK